MKVHISVIIPTCHRPILLKRALKSVARQTLAPGEVVVVYDSDESYEDLVKQIVNKMDLKRVLVRKNSHAPGASGARNTAAEVATEELLAFLDDDDEWLASYLHEALQHFQACKLDVLCTDLLYRFPDGSERAGKNAPECLKPDLFLTRNPGLIGSNLIIRRSLYREIGGFDESLPTLEDMDLGFRMSRYGSVRYQPLRRRLVRHYHHSGPRLCIPTAEPMRAGVRRFYELHGHRMSAAQVREFNRVFAASTC